MGFKIEKKTGEEILHLENDIENLIPLDDINPELQNLVIFDDFIMSNNLSNITENALINWMIMTVMLIRIYCVYD